MTATSHGCRRTGGAPPAPRVPFLGAPASPPLASRGSRAAGGRVGRGGARPRWGAQRCPRHEIDPPALELRGVSAGYGRIEVVHDLDLAVPAGCVVALLGPNGAGKTTTLAAIAGTIPL